MMTKSKRAKASPREKDPRQAEEEQDVDEEGDSMTGLIKRLAENTGVQGVPNITRARSTFRRLLWLTVVLVGIGMLFFMVSSAFIKYYTFPVDTKIELLYSPQLTFPAVTICNLNPIRLSALDEAGEDMHNKFGPANKPPPQNSSTSGQPDKFFDWNDHGFVAKTDEFSEMQDFMALVSMLSAEQRLAVGHQIDWMLLACSFQGVQCTPRNFTLFHNYLYGNCFTFNAEHSTEEKGLKVNKVGPLFGLSVELYVEQGEYMEQITDAAGFRVYIHNQTDMPFPEDTGFSVPPGTATSVGIKRVQTTRVVPPWGTCREFSDQENLERNAFAQELPKINYTTSACKKTCLQQHLVRDCGCFDPRYPFCHNCVTFENFVSWTNETKMAPCSDPKQASEKDACVFNVTSRFVEDHLGCSQWCPTECFSVSYEHTVSTSMWPSSVKEVEIMDKLARKSHELYDQMNKWNEGQRKGFIRENLLKLEVYYEDLNYLTVITSSSYGALELLSELGGQAGLWLGMSMIALFEVVELFMDLAAYCGGKCKGNAANGDSTERTDLENPRKLEDKAREKYGTSRPWHPTWEDEDRSERYARQTRATIPWNVEDAYRSRQAPAYFGSTYYRSPSLPFRLRPYDR